MKTFILMGMVSAGLMASASSAIIQFDLQGQAGAGLLPGNELHVVTSGGTGGEVGGGIFFDTSTNLLTINVAWGSGNGFVDMSGVVTGSHLHGPAGQAATAGVLIFLSRADSSANNGSIGQTVLVGSGDVANLLAGNTYINLHTGTNGSGEARGNLVQVPEPSAWLLGVAGGAFLLRRRR